MFRSWSIGRFGRPLLNIIAVALVSLVAMLVLASSPASADGGLDPGRADDLTHRALPGPSDLPGNNWQVTKQDDFTHGDTPSTTACNNSQGKIDQIGDQIASIRAGRAEVELTNQDSSLSIDVSVEIYTDTKALSDSFAQAGAAFKSDDLVQCFVDTLKSDPSIGKTSDLSVKATPNLAKLPSGAVGRGLDVALPSQNLALHAEAYFWLYGNTAVTVRLTGSPSDVNRDISQFMVDGMQKTLDYLSSH